MKYFVYIALILFATELFGQKDTSSIHLGEVEIRDDSLLKKNYSNVIYYEFSEEEIQNSVYSDIGSLINTISNVNLKDYGGVGGLKTVSVRGFSSMNTGVLINNLPITNSQTGSINLGNFRTDNIFKMSFVLGSINEILYPAKSNSFVSTINLVPRELKNDFKKLNVFIAGSFGSFTTTEPFVSVNGKIGKNGFIGVNFRYLYSKGNYPYEINNGQAIVEGKRENSKVNSYQINLGGVQGLKKGKVEYRLSYFDSDKGLPGAVIYYDSTQSEQVLLNSSFDAQFNYKFKNEKWSVLAFGNYNYDYTNYKDPNFLNSTGGLDDSYWMNNYYFGTTFSIQPIKKLAILMGIDETYSTLNSTKIAISNTHRSDLKGLLGVNYSFWRMKIKANAVLTYLEDKNQELKTFSTLKVNPFVSIGVFPFKKSLFHIQTYYKNSLRPPTMNEIYYNQVVKDLEPETSHQFNFGMSYKKTEWSFFDFFNIGADFYFNIVQNKIVLIPTQNLFVWSVQNIGKSNITGVDVNIAFRTKEFKYFLMFWDLKYSLMLALDKTDPSSKTYNNQLPYIPKNNFTATFGFEIIGFGISWSLNYGGTRYALGENIEANKLDDYLINDFAMYYKYKLKDGKNSLKLKLDVRNILNADYVMVKAFPMPGINYNVKLIYEFNN